jgi:tetratricopeptide (TPR) repeat protein
MAKTFYSRPINWLIPILIVVSVILAASGRPIFAIIGGFFAVAIPCWQHFKSLVDKQQNDNLAETQARMFLKNKLGNQYSESILNDVRSNGRTEVLDRLVKALNLDPDDEFALGAFASAHALGISGRKARGVAISSAEIQSAKDRCEHGRKLYPNNSQFVTSLGVLADAEGDHEKAREWFQKSGPLGPPGYWRLHMATSYGMSGQFDKSLAEIEQAVSEGANVWWVHFYRGRTLCSLGRYVDALPELKIAFRQRRFHPEVTHWLVIACHCQASMGSEILYRFWQSILFVTIHPWKGITGVSENAFRTASHLR